MLASQAKRIPASAGQSRALNRASHYPQSGRL